MAQPDLKVSVIVATYNPGERFQRLVSSLDRQSLPQNEWEVLLVDDGSAADEVARLQQAASERTNWRVLQLEPSGWPSRPRNTGVDQARGEYVAFVDHDDEIMPDGLRAAYAFAAANGADVLNAKESQTDVTSWAMQLYDENRSNIRHREDPFPLAPMNPHKLYRTAFLREHGIRFFEGARILYEDNLFNLEALSRAKVISVLADTPYYHWVRDGTSTGSSTFRRDPKEYFGSLARVLKASHELLSDPRDNAIRDAAILYQHRLRFAGHFRAAWGRRLAEDREADIRLMAPIIDEYIPESIDHALPAPLRVRMHLFRQGEFEALARFARLDEPLAPQHTLLSLAPSARADGLEIVTKSVWRTGAGAPLDTRVEDGRFIRRVPADLENLIPRGLLDFTDELRSTRTAIAGRVADPLSSWAFPSDSELTVEDSGLGDEAVFITSGLFQPSRAQLGKPGPDGLWRIGVDALMFGTQTQRRVTVPRTTRAAQLLVEGGRHVIAGSEEGRLTLAVDVPWRLAAVGNRAMHIAKEEPGYRISFPHVTVSERTPDYVAIVLVPRLLARIGRRLPRTWASAIERSPLSKRVSLERCPAGSSIVLSKDSLRLASELYFVIGDSNELHPLKIAVGWRKGALRTL